MEFICLDPRKAKRDQINLTLSSLGKIHWLPFLFVRFTDYAESGSRAAAALETAARTSSSSIIRAVKFQLYKWQYNSARHLFESRKGAVAVCWNGLNGTRRVFMDAAKDAGSKTLYFELAPFRGRVTVDPCGVNFNNSLPRDSAPYLAWADRYGRIPLESFKSSIRQRPALRPAKSVEQAQRIDEKFVFLPLQVPGDSQLRIFGGNYKRLDTLIDSLERMAEGLPEGWHLRVKEHPSSKISYAARILKSSNNRLVLDNQTDTFSQVRASRAVMTVNSSVGLEAMFFDKPVLVLGQCFWAIPGVAIDCSLESILFECLSNPEALSYREETRSAFLSYLLDEYYPDIYEIKSDGSLRDTEVLKIRSRLLTSETAANNRWMSNALNAH